MPTVLRLGRFRFHFYSNEGSEPAHIHVRTVDGECKHWLNPIVLANNRGLSPHELRQIERIIYEQQSFLTEKYYEFHRR